MTELWSDKQVKQVQIVIPFDKTESVYEFLHDVLEVKNIMKFNADNAHVLQVRVSDSKIMKTIEGLKSRGVGVEYGYVDVFDLSASLPRETAEADSIVRAASISVEGIHESVSKQASFSFDFMALVIVAAVVAGGGLIQNNVAYIVASMVLSPMMGPMMGVALGYILRDKKLFIKGTRNELIALALSFGVGAILAILLPIPFINPYAPQPFVDVVIANWEAGILTEITRRGYIFTALDIGVAIFSGAAVAVSITKGDMSTLVGVAISAALMPPAVNVGLMLTLGLVTGSSTATTIGFWSFVLLVMNIILIDVAAAAMFRIKKLGGMVEKSAEWKAVTTYRKSTGNSLYHSLKTSIPTGEGEKTEAAMFRPAEDSQAPKREEENRHRS